MVERRVKFLEHGAEYFICRSKKYGDRLCGRTLTQSGKVDKEAWQVEEAPKSFRKGHREVLKKLGIKSKKMQDKMLRNVSYY